MSLPDFIKPLDTMNLVKGYVFAVGVVKSEARGFPINKPPAGWINFGKPPRSLQIKFIKIDVGTDSARFEANVRARSPNQLLGLQFWDISKKHVFPRIERIWLEDATGHKVSLGTRVVQSHRDGDGRINATAQGGVSWSGKHHYTTLKIQVIEKTEPVRLKFELHNIKVPAYVPPKSGAGKP